MRSGWAAGFVLVATALALPARPADPARRVIDVHYTPQDRAEGRYQYVPFDVPAGTTRLTFGYAYDRAGGRNVVDLGVFEPGSLDLGTPAFRGWSGGERRTVTITATEATPGYWPGPLPAGQWHVALGLYKVAESGLDVSLTVETEAGGVFAKPLALPARPAEPLRRGARWYSGGLHIHTVHSDGALTVAEVSAKARAAGLDFIAITDHNNTTHQTEAVPEDGLLRIVGEEITTPGGHASAWGLGGVRNDIDFRVLPGDPRIADLVRAVNARGALFSINHPSAACAGCGWEHGVPEGVMGIEITNGNHAEMAQAIALWDRLLKEGRRLVAVGSSDWHRGANPIDLASVRVWADELSTRAILAGIRAGRVVVMADGRTPPPLMVANAGRRRAGAGETLAVGTERNVRVDVTLPLGLLGGRVDLVADGAVVATKPATTRVRFERPIAGDHYLRVHVFAADGAPRAVTNPVFLERRR
jgi:PHP domain-containing protein